MAPLKGDRGGSADMSTEQTPLLREVAPEPESNGAPPTSATAPEAEDSVPLPDQLSSTKLTITLGACWFGVFLNALGEIQPNVNNGLGSH